MRGAHMGKELVAWWCTTIGITDEGAVQVAAVVFAGGSLIILGVMILTIVIGALLMMRRSQRAKNAGG
jgi:hypothetical protein